MQEAINKADVLIEALEYIRRFRGKIVVVKVGGSVQESAESLHSLLTDVVFMSTVGMRPILIHGGAGGVGSSCHSGSRSSFTVVM